ncbi:MAG TPA: 16S rRNA (cytidine(1402)-2'-O)-methyltransferase, partial [Chromatiales bacterium]|nr:16S rRNA (cytidine(1402)-2'-O)-methyltransferase [Chromatiales bacterium]
VALVSDAGTPLLSDPGFPLVRAARQAGIRVVPVPGPSAIVAALSVAGIPCQRFAFEGFLPARAGARRAALAALAEEPRTLVFFEAAHRIRASLVDMAAAFGAGRETALARELTKLHEEVLHGTLAELVEALAEHPAREKGEFVVIVAGAPAPPPAVAGDEDAVLRVLLRHLGTRDAAQVAAELTGRPRKALYRRALALAGRAPQQDESPPEA